MIGQRTGDEQRRDVGIDRVIERAGVAKASLYSTYGSKDELVRAYLELRAERRRERINERLALHDAPRAKLASVFDLLDESFANPDYRGCAFVNVSSESPGERAREVCISSRAWVRGIFAQIARDGGCTAPDVVGAELMIVYDGAMVSAQMERDRNAAKTGHALALDIFDRAPRSDRAAR